jgi:hypothetical protein
MPKLLQTMPEMRTAVMGLQHIVQSLDLGLVSLSPLLFVYFMTTVLACRFHVFLTVNPVFWIAHLWVSPAYHHLQWLAIVVAEWAVAALLVRWILHFHFSRATRRAMGKQLRRFR